MASFTSRKNTLVIDFSMLPVRPNTKDVEKFIRGDLRIKLNIIKNIQVHTIRKCALIEMRTYEIAEKLSISHHLKHFIEAENKRYNIPVYMEDAATNDRIHDLPPSIPNEAIAEHMQQYGRVKSVARELWKKFFPGIPNDLDKHIPSFIKILNEVTTVSYRTQIRTCRRCERKVHHKLTCSEAAKQNVPLGEALPKQPKQ